MIATMPQTQAVHRCRSSGIRRSEYDRRSYRAKYLRGGRNCGRVALANRVAFVIDGDDYFKMFMRAAERARESIIIIAWDFNSNCCLNVTCDPDGPDAKLAWGVSCCVRRRGLCGSRRDEIGAR